MEGVLHLPVHGQEGRELSRCEDAHDEHDHDPGDPLPRAEEAPGTGRRPAGTPFGGWKHSGLGKENCLEELLSYTREKTVTVSL